jgi:hypothetical protein
VLEQEAARAGLEGVVDVLVPDGHAVRRQVELVSSGQRAVFGKRVGKRRDWFFEKVEDRPLNCPSHRLGKGLDLLPGVPGEANEPITH